MLRSFLCLFLLFFLNASIQANESYNGYCITKEGDTLKGKFLNFKQGEMNPVKMDFMDTVSMKSYIIIPEKCSFFSIDGYDSYISYHGPRMTNPINSQGGQVVESKFAPGNKYDTINAFLRLIGRTNNIEFFLYNDRARINIFSRNELGKVEELIYKVVISNSKKSEMHYYRQQVFNLFASKIDSVELKKTTKRLTYSESSFAEFVEKFTPVTRVKYKDPLSGFSLRAGAAINFYSLSTVSGVEYLNMDFDVSISPVIGLSYQISSKRNHQRIIYQAQLRLYKHVNFGYNSDSSISETVESDFILTPSLMVGYKFINKEQFKFLMSAGLSWMFLNNNLTTRTYYGSSEHVVFFEEENFTYALNLNADLYFKNRYILGLNYTLPATTINHVYYKGAHSSLQVGIGYKF